MTQFLDQEILPCINLRLAGDVQGCGIRPAVAALATRLGLRGSVCNSRQGVEIQIVGHSAESADLIQFQRGLLDRFPNARQTSLLSAASSVPCRFSILDSQTDGDPNFVVPLDRVVCSACLAECLDPSDRRFGYALNGCAQCGPRYSIVARMPYDRALTSMSGFAMCADCRAEYEDVTHRRFHAQTNCCPLCGPQMWFECDAGRVDGVSGIAAAAQAIASGQIIAIKGLGGYQLVCDASNDLTIERLRERKLRPEKPLAVMVATMEHARSIAEIDAHEADCLQSAAGPIVLVRSLASCQLGARIHPGLSRIGLMLPTTASHALLLNAVARPVVVTSGNLEGEPIEYDVDQARLQLGQVAEGFLHHDRPILRPIDDSVVCCMAGKPVTLRAARGLAPLIVGVDETNSNVTALGGEQKVSVAVANGRTMVLGPHIGEVRTLRSRERYVQQKRALQQLMEAKSNSTAHDLHPDYFTSRHAYHEGCESAAVQHHHAHVVSGMCEHGWLEREVLGFAFDGSGLGTDGTIWGGEVLLSRRDRCKRLAHLRPFPLVGGELAIAAPWRVATVLLIDACGLSAALELCRSNLCHSWGIEFDQIAALAGVADRQGLSMQTTSMGRLFDGVAAIVGGFGTNSYEGESAMRLEASCNRNSADSYRFSWVDGSPYQLDWRPIIRDIVRDVGLDVDRADMAMKFHQCIASAVAYFAKQHPELPVVLVGGVFQNRLLVEQVAALFADHAASLGLPGTIPPNDGGLAVGQLIVASSRRLRPFVCA